MKALVLSGGGAKGSYEAGLVTTLIGEFGESFDIICGTSIGAINAAFLAQDEPTALAELWHTIAAANIVSPLPHVAVLQGMFTSVVGAFGRRGWGRIPAWYRASTSLIAGLRRLNPLDALLALTGALDPHNTQALLNGKLDLAKVRHILITTTTDLASATADVFCHFPDSYTQLRSAFMHEEPCAREYAPALFAETIRASGAIPAAFSPVQFQGDTHIAAHVDGGVVNNTPIGQAIDAGATEVTIIYLDPLPDKSAPRTVPKSVPEILLACFGIMQQRILELDYQTALRVNDAVGADADDTKAKRIIRLRTFRPQTALAVGVLDFDKQSRVDQAWAQGQTDARAVAARLNWQS